MVVSLVESIEGWQKEGGRIKKRDGPPHYDGLASSLYNPFKCCNG